MAREAGGKETDPRGRVGERIARSGRVLIFLLKLAWARARDFASLRPSTRISEDYRIARGVLMASLVFRRHPRRLGYEAGGGIAVFIPEDHAEPREN